MNKKDRRYLYTLIITLIVVSFVLFYRFIFLDTDFVRYNDQQFQRNIFYEEWYKVIRETITNKRPSFYSWNTFLGTDFYVSKLMYCVGDFIITPIFIFAKEMPDLNNLLIFETVICIVLSGVLFYTFLQEFEIEDSRIKYLMSMIYSLSGFVVMYAGSYMFHRFYTLFPLMLIYTEKYRKNKESTSVFSLVIALLFMQNYELMFSSSIFLILYYIFHLNCIPI